MLEEGIKMSEDYFVGVYPGDAILENILGEGQQVMTVRCRLCGGTGELKYYEKKPMSATCGICNGTGIRYFIYGSN